MPTTINGIGTMYIGRRNHSSSAGQCEFCGSQTTKSDYETTLFFTFLYIPLIPLGKKQVLGECSLCRRHRAAAAEDWGRLRDGQIEEAQQAAEQKGDSAGLIELIQTCRAFHRDDEAAAAVRQLEERFGKEPTVQFFLGAYYEDRLQPAESHRHFREAFRLAPSEWPYRRAVALCDLEANDPAAAAALLKTAEPPSANFEPGLFVLLARGYQQRGQHDQAHRVLTNVLQAAPALAANKDFRQTIRASEKSLGIMQSAVPVDPIWRSAKFWWATAAVLLIAAIFGSNYFIAQHRTAYVVNGLAVPLTVVLDGDRELTVGPRTWQKVAMAEGKHIAGVKQPIEIAEEEFEMRAGWFGRFFSTPAFVIDPAKAAVVVRETAHYSANPAADEDEAPQIHVGQLFTQYDDVDYLFEEFPQSLKVESKSKRVSKTRVALMPLPAEQVLFAALAQGQGQEPELSPTGRLSLLETHLRTMPAAEMDNSRLAMGAYVALAAGEEHRARRDELLRARLAERPLLVEWHRVYQSVREGDGATDELVREYDALLGQSPGDAALLYLRGRIDPDPPRAMEFFQKSQGADPRFPHTWGAIAFHQNLEGQFGPALESLEKAVANKPGNPEFQMRLRDARFAAQRFPELEQELKAEHAKEVDAMAPVEALFEVYSRTGNRAAAESLLTEYKPTSRALLSTALSSRATSPKGMPGGQGDPEALAEVTLRYFQGNLAAVEKAAAQLSDETQRQFWQDALRVERGQVDQVKSLSSWSGDEAAFLELCRYLELASAGPNDKAAAALEKAAAAFQTGAPRHRRVAQLLKQPQVSDDDLRRLEPREPVQKSLVLAALATRHAPQREKLLSLAERLNYRLAFPHGFVERQIAQVRKLPEAGGTDGKPKAKTGEPKAEKAAGGP